MFACFGPRLFNNLFINWLVNVLILHRLSNWLHVVYMLIKKGRVNTNDTELKIAPIELKLASIEVRHSVIEEESNGSSREGNG